MLKIKLIKKSILLVFIGLITSIVLPTDVFSASNQQNLEVTITQDGEENYILAVTNLSNNILENVSGNTIIPNELSSVFESKRIKWEIEDLDKGESHSINLTVLGGKLADEDSSLPDSSNPSDSIVVTKPDTSGPKPNFNLVGPILVTKPDLSVLLKDLKTNSTVSLKDKISDSDKINNFTKAVTSSADKSPDKIINPNGQSTTGLTSVLKVSNTSKVLESTTVELDDESTNHSEKELNNKSDLIDSTKDTYNTASKNDENNSIFKTDQASNKENSYKVNKGINYIVIALAIIFILLLIVFFIKKGKYKFLVVLILAGTAVPLTVFADEKKTNEFETVFNSIEGKEYIFKTSIQYTLIEENPSNEDKENTNDPNAPSTENVTGTLYDTQNQLLVNATFNVINKNGDKQIITTDEKGYFIVRLTPGQIYKIENDEVDIRFEFFEINHIDNIIENKGYVSFGTTLEFEGENKIVIQPSVIVISDDDNISELDANDQSVTFNHDYNLRKGDAVAVFTDEYQTGAFFVLEAPFTEQQKSFKIMSKQSQNNKWLTNEDELSKFVKEIKFSNNLNMDYNQKIDLQSLLELTDTEIEQLENENVSIENERHIDFEMNIHMKYDWLENNYLIEQFVTHGGINENIHFGIESEVGLSKSIKEKIEQMKLSKTIPFPQVPIVNLQPSIGLDLELSGKYQLGFSIGLNSSTDVWYSDNQFLGNTDIETIAKIDGIDGTIEGKAGLIAELPLCLGMEGFSIQLIGADMGFGAKLDAESNLTGPIDLAGIKGSIKGYTQGSLHVGKINFGEETTEPMFTIDEFENEIDIVETKDIKLSLEPNTEDIVAGQKYEVKALLDDIELAPDQYLFSATSSQSEKIKITIENDKRYLQTDSDISTATSIEMLAVSKWETLPLFLTGYGIHSVGVRPVENLPIYDVVFENNPLYLGEKTKFYVSYNDKKFDIASDDFEITTSNPNLKIDKQNGTLTMQTDDPINIGQVNINVSHKKDDVIIGKGTGLLSIAETPNTIDFGIDTMSINVNNTDGADINTNLLFFARDDMNTYYQVNNNRDYVFNFTGIISLVKKEIYSQAIHLVMHDENYPYRYAIYLNEGDFKDYPNLEVTLHGGKERDYTIKKPSTITGNVWYVFDYTGSTVTKMNLSEILNNVDELGQYVLTRNPKNLRTMDSKKQITKEPITIEATEIKDNVINGIENDIEDSEVSKNEDSLKDELEDDTANDIEGSNNDTTDEKDSILNLDSSVSESIK